MFPVERRLLSEVEHNGAMYRAYLVATGATTKDVVQITRLENRVQKAVGFGSGILMKKSCLTTILLIRRS